MAPTDRDVLCALYKATDGPNWKKNANWGTDAALSDSYGVSANGEDRVVELSLDDNNLRELNRLQLAESCQFRECGLQVHGSGKIKQVYRPFYEIVLEGAIPAQLGALNKLTWLDLSRNQLSGPIPPELGELRELLELWLFNNQLTGSIPPELGNLAELRTLALSNNRLEGAIPKELGLLSELLVLDFSENQLTGHIPKELGALSELRELQLWGNDLTGPIPPELGNLAGLQILYLNDNKLSGPIPKELGALVKLQYLRLSNNQLSGTIPKELGKLTALQALSLDSNNLTGSIPPQLGNLTALQQLSLWGNQLRGKIAGSIGQLGYLQTPGVRSNNLSGPVPQELKSHPNFVRFTFGFAMDGPPLPEVKSPSHAIKIMIIPILLGYFDLGSDLYTAVSYYQSGHPIWFGLGLFFALGPAILVSAFFIPGSDTDSVIRRVLVATQLGLLFEAFLSVVDAEYSDILALVRVIEPLFESLPQLLLQLYALLVLWVDTSSSSSPRRLVFRVVSVCISAASLAYAATDVCSVERLMHKTERLRDCTGCPSLSLTGQVFGDIAGVVFSRVPDNGSSTLNGLGNVHPRSHVWLCFVYHVLEIVSRSVSLSLLALVMRGWFFLVLPYLWASRCLIVFMAALKAGDRVGLDAGCKALREFRFRVRLVAMPFLDSVMDGTVAFASGLTLTLAEFIACLLIYRFYRHDDLPSRVWLVLNEVAISCMVGKMCLALVAIYPLTKEDGDTGGVVTGGAVAGSEVTAMREAQVECEIAPSGGGQLEPATQAAVALVSSSASGDTKVEDGVESV